MVDKKLGRFGHHPEPAADFCVEVDAIEGMEADVSAGLSSRIQLVARIDRAMTFRVGGDQHAVAAKQKLREVEARVKPRTQLMIDLSEDQAKWLEAIVRGSSYGPGSVEDLIYHLINSAADGARRPGSWEAGWLRQAVPIDGEIEVSQ